MPINCQDRARIENALAIIAIITIVLVIAIGVLA